MKKTLLLYSSARRYGNTFQFVDTLNQMYSCQVCYLDNLDIAQYDYQFNNQHDDFIGLIDLMLTVDIIVLASPVYWYSLTPRLRCFFDRFTDLTELPHLKYKGKQLRSKQFWLLATSVHDEPPESFISPVKNTLAHLGWQFCDCEHINCKTGFNTLIAQAKLSKLVTYLNGQQLERPIQTNI